MSPPLGPVFFTPLRLSPVRCSLFVITFGSALCWPASFRPLSLRSFHPGSPAWPADLRVPPLVASWLPSILYLILVKQATLFYSSHCTRHCLLDPLVSSVNIRYDTFIYSGTAL